MIYTVKDLVMCKMLVEVVSIRPQVIGRGRFYRP